MHHNHVRGFIALDSSEALKDYRDKLHRNLVALVRSQKHTVNGLSIESIDTVGHSEEKPAHYRFYIGDKDREVRLLILAHRSRSLTKKLKELLSVHSIMVVFIHRDFEDRLIRGKIMEAVRIKYEAYRRSVRGHRTEKRIKPSWASVSHAQAA